MSTSQFTIYSSSDGSAPALDGQAGSLINVLNGCLVTGYGAKAAPSPAWTHPVATASNIASYAQGAGAGFGLVINDSGPNVTSTTKEAWATGWESVAGVGSPVGSGSGQFPTAAQLLTSGHCVIRKSTATGSTTRTWMVFADSSTFYLLINSGDFTNTYFVFMFGDIFSFKGVTDAYRCMIMGRSTENSTASETADNGSAIGTALAAHFMARTYGGGGTSITVGKSGDTGKAQASPSTPYTFLGSVQTPNGPDNAWYLAPIVATENSASTIRGRLRGLYHICHPIASFTDGQQLVGAGDYSGKTIQVIKSTVNSGILGIEISATVETNS
jgi:hypothetical protein